MGSRTAIPLHRDRQRVLVEHLDPRENNVNQHKGMVTHLLVGTGVRNDTCGHTHADWFTYRDGELYLQVPAEDDCRKDTRNEVCVNCDPTDEKPFYPKTPAAGGRMIHIGNEYYDYSTGERRYFGLRDRVESYFSISPPGEPAVGGFDMIQANGSNGVSHKTVNTWVREVCTSAGLSKQVRETRLKKDLEPDKEKNDDGEMEVVKTVDEKIADRGTDDQGRPIPDIFAHDLRASFCTQLCRADDPNYSKIMAKTGHKNEETLYRYVGFAGDELDPKADAKMF